MGFPSTLVMTSKVNIDNDIIVLMMTIINFVVPNFPIWPTFLGCVCSTVPGFPRMKPLHC